MQLSRSGMFSGCTSVATRMPECAAGPDGRGVRRLRWKNTVEGPSPVRSGPSHRRLPPPQDDDKVAPGRYTAAGAAVTAVASEAQKAGKVGSIRSGIPGGSPAPQPRRPCQLSCAQWSLRRAVSRRTSWPCEFLRAANARAAAARPLIFWEQGVSDRARCPGEHGVPGSPASSAERRQRVRACCRPQLRPLLPPTQNGIKSCELFFVDVNRVGSNQIFWFHCVRARAQCV